MAKAEILPQANELCRVSKGTKINGIMVSSADVRVDGVFEGTLYTKGKLVIGEAAHVKGTIFCQSCDLWGRAEGDIYIEDIINFKANSNFTGSLKTPKLGIEIGSIFNGSCNIITKEEYNRHLADDKDVGKETKGAVSPVPPQQAGKKSA